MLGYRTRRPLQSRELGSGDVYVYYFALADVLSFFEYYLWSVLKPV